MIKIESDNWLPSDDDEQFSHTGCSQKRDQMSPISEEEPTQITIMVEPRYYEFDHTAVSEDDDQPVHETGLNRIPQQPEEVDPLSL